MTESVKTGEPVYSDYSRHFQTLDAETVARNEARLEGRFELYRLELDLIMIRRYMKSGDLLDFPIGTGRIYPRFLSEQRVHGYDICEPYIQRAREAHPEIAERFQVNSFESIADAKSFNTILSFRVLDNIQDKQLAMRNVFAITKPGGRWIFTYAPTAEGGTRGDMESWLSAAGFDLVACPRYDVQAVSRGLIAPLRRAWDYWRAAIQRGWVPFWAYRLSDALMPGAGTHLFVAERPA